MAHVGNGFLRNQVESKPILAEGRALRRANRDNPQVAHGVPAHDSRGDLARAAASARPVALSSHGGTMPVTGGPASARPPQRPAR
jgi:hypothetical protein